MFAFLDIETTGLDPKTDFILEIGWVLTDGYLNELLPGKSSIVEQPYWPVVYDKIDSNAFVQQMHNASGLRQDMQFSTQDRFLDLREIREEFMADVMLARRGVTGEPVHLAGYSVGFDRGFLEETPEWGPLFKTKEFGWQMHHRLLDLSSVIMLYGTADRPAPVAEVYNTNPHRALNDALDSLDVARQMSREISWIPA